MKKGFIYITLLLIFCAGSLWSDPPNNFMGGALFKDNDPRLPKEGDTIKTPETVSDVPKGNLPVLPRADDGINLADSKPVTTPSGEDKSDYIPVLPAEDAVTSKNNYPLDNSFDNLVSVPIKETDLSLLEELNELKIKVSNLESLLAAKSAEKPTNKQPSINPLDLKLLENLRKKVDELEQHRKDEALKKPVTTLPAKTIGEKDLPKEDVVKINPENKNPIAKDSKTSQLTTVNPTKDLSGTPAKENVPVKTAGEYIEDSNPHRVYYLEKGDFRPAGNKDGESSLSETTPVNAVKKNPVINKQGKGVKSDKIEPVKMPKEIDSPVVNNIKEDVDPVWEEWDKTVLRDGGNVYSSLSPGYYVQVGAYSLKTSTAQATIKRLKSKNIAAPVKVLRDSRYQRVLVGNLRKDEVGRILTKMESIGYRKTLLIWVK